MVYAYKNFSVNCVEGWQLYTIIRTLLSISNILWKGTHLISHKETRISHKFYF